MRRLLPALMVTSFLTLGARSSLAQMTLAPRYVAAQQRPVYVTAPARTYVVAPAPRYARRTYVMAPRPMRYAAPRTYYAPGPFQRYRGAVDSGRDPNWATGRGVPLYKPWEY